MAAAPAKAPVRRGSLQESPVFQNVAKFLAEKQKETRTLFTNYFVESLHIEYRYIQDVSAGFHESRLSERDQYLNMMLSAVNMVSGQIPVPGASIVIGQLVGLASRQIQDNADKANHSQLASISGRANEVQRNLLFMLLAKEMWYRYGAAVLNFVYRPNNKATSDLVLRGIARIGAVRALFYAMSNGVRLDIQNVLTIVNGVIDAFSAFPEKTKLDEIYSGEIIFGSTKQSVQGLYTLPGRLEPGLRFYLQDIGGDVSADNNSSNNSSSATATTTGVISLKGKVAKLLGKGKGGIPPELLPYGLINVGAGYVCEEGFKVRPYQREDSEVFSVRLALNFNHRYVNINHIIDYLLALKKPGSGADGKSFSAWLSSEKKHMSEFQTDFMPVFRGRIDGPLLASREVDFAAGIFDGMDFSFCTFFKVSVANMRQCKVFGTEFLQCTVVRGGLNGSSLIMCRLAETSFQGAVGVLCCEYCSFTKCDFSNSQLNLTWTDNVQDPDTLKSLEKGGGTEAGGSPYTAILELSARQDRLQAEQRKADDKAKQDRLMLQQAVDNNNKLQEQLDLIRAQRDIEREIEAANAAKRAEEAARKVFAEYTEGKSLNEQPPAACVDKNGIAESIRELKGQRLGPCASQQSEEVIMHKLLDAIFFQRPVEMLEGLQYMDVLQSFRDLPPYCIISTSGQDGPDGTDGEDGEDGNRGGGMGGEGRPGQHGQIGTSARDNVVSLVSVPGQDVFLVSPKDNGTPMNILRLKDGNVSINLYAMGGKGGRGGRGGHGGVGCAGRPGKDASEYSAGTSGTHGGNGGNGANGGNGGNAGHSSNIDVYVKPHDLDLFSLMGNVVNGPVEGGFGGQRGMGGPGGKGGPGGDAYVYYETDSNNNSHRRVNPGGEDGADGIPGKVGIDGAHGLPGQTGTVNFFIVNDDGKMERYGGLYNFAVGRVGALESESGIIEPGQVIQVSRVQVRNIGLMRSPNSLELHMVTNSFICAAENWVMGDSIRPNGSIELTEVKSFKISPNLQSSFINAPLHVDTQLELYAMLPRTMKVYKNLCESIPIHIQYPVEMSVIHGGSVCVPGELVPFTVTLRNISRIALGLRSQSHRKLFVTIEAAVPGARDDFVEDLFVRIGQTTLATGKAVAPTPSTSSLQETKYSLLSPLTFDISFMAPESSLTLSGAFGVEAHNTSFYDRVFYRISLHLGPIDSPLNAIIIQQEQESFQVGEYFVPPVCTECTATGELTGNTKCCLLVVNCFTTKEEVSYWRQLFSKTGLGLCIYNVSIYHGLSLFDERFNLYKHFKFNVVVILNSPYARDDNRGYFMNNRLFYPLQYVAIHEIFDAARYHGIRTYVVNFANGKSEFSTLFPKFLKPLFSFQMTEAEKTANTFDGRKKMYAYLKEKDAGPRDELLPRRNIYCTIKLFRALTTANTNDFDQRINELSANLSEIRPDRQYFLDKRFHEAVHGKETKRWLFSRQDLGEVEVRRGLDMCYATVAMRDTAVMPKFAINRCESDEVYDMFTIFKLLPIAGKMHLFCALPVEDPVRDILVAALVSDVADELKLFVNFARGQTFARMKVALGMDKRTTIEALGMDRWMNTLNYIKDFDFTNFLLGTTEGDFGNHGAAHAGTTTEEGIASPNDVAVNLEEIYLANKNNFGDDEEQPQEMLTRESLVYATAKVDKLMQDIRDSSAAAASDNTSTTSSAGAGSSDGDGEGGGNQEEDDDTDVISRATSGISTCPSSILRQVSVMVASDSPQMQALNRLVVMIRVMASQVRVQFIKTHVKNVCYQLLLKYRPDLTIDMFRGLRSKFEKAEPNHPVVRGDGADPFALQRQQYLFNHWCEIDNLILSNSDLEARYHEAGVTHSRMADPTNAAEFTRMVDLYGASPTYRVDTKNTSRAFLPVDGVDGAAKSAKTVQYQQDKATPTTFGVRGNVVA